VFEWERSISKPQERYVRKRGERESGKGEREHNCENEGNILPLLFRVY